MTNRLLLALLPVFVCCSCSTTTPPTATSVAAGAGIPYREAKERLNTKAKALLTAAFSSPSEQSLQALFSRSDVFLCGPLLWGRISAVDPNIVPDRGISSIVPLNSRKGYPRTVATFTGSSLKREDGSATTFVKGLLKEYRDLELTAVRKLTEQERAQYWAMICLDAIEEPIFMVELGERKVLVHFDSDLTIFTIDDYSRYNQDLDAAAKAAAEKEHAEFIAKMIKEFGTREAAAKAHAQEGWRALMEGEIKDALSILRRGVLLQPDNAACYWGQSVALNHAVMNGIGSPKTLPTAVWCAEEAHRLEPANHRILGDLAMAYAQLAGHVESDRSEALLGKAATLCLRAIEKEPEFAQFYLIFAAVRTRQKDTAAARELIGKARELGLPLNDEALGVFGVELE